MLLLMMIMMTATNTIITESYSVLQCACHYTKSLFILSHLIPLTLLGGVYYYSHLPKEKNEA